MMKTALTLIITLCFLTLTDTGCGSKLSFTLPVKNNETSYLCDPFVLNNYFYGKLLGTQDFKEEQSYFRGKNQLKKSDGKNLIRQIFQNHSVCYTSKNDIPIVLAKIHIRKSGKIEDDDIDNISFRRLVLNSSDILLLLENKLED